MYLKKEVIESLANQGVYVSMFPNDEERKRAYESKLAEAEKSYRYVSRIDTYDRETGKWITEGVERPDYKQRAKKSVDNDFENTAGFWGMWYDAETIYIRKGDVFAKRRVGKGEVIEEDWVLKVLDKESKVYEGPYGQFAIDVQKLYSSRLSNLYGWVYPTTYGIGVWVFYNCNADECVKGVESVLKENNIEYTNEFSDARMVYRFKISKKEINRNKLSCAEYV